MKGGGIRGQKRRKERGGRDKGLANGGRGRSEKKALAVREREDGRGSGLRDKEKNCLREETNKQKSRRPSELAKGKYT